MSLRPETEHLAGCPSCDVAPVVTESDGPWFVGCANPDCPLQCEARGYTRAEAERLWNVRTAEQRLREQRDAEREAVVRYRDRIAVLEVEVDRLRETLAVLDEAAEANRAIAERLRAALVSIVGRGCFLMPRSCRTNYPNSRDLWCVSCVAFAALAGGGNG